MNYPNNYGYGFNPYMQNPEPSRSNDIQYVNGLESAKAFPMGTNSSVILMDSGEPKFYLKKTDASGFADIKTYVFSEYQETPPQENYVLKTEFYELKEQMNNLSTALEKALKTQNKGSKGGNE